MTKKSAVNEKHSVPDLEKIRKRASEIWKRKCQSLNTALDDWLQAERELRAQAGIEHKKAESYTRDEMILIRKRAQAIRDEKVRSLRTAFDDWIEAEQELKGELGAKITANEFFDLWFRKSSAHVASLLKKDASAPLSSIHDFLGKQYVELMTECMT